MYDRQRMVVTVRYIPGELGAANADDIVWCGGKGITNVVPFRVLSTQHSRLKERCVWHYRTAKHAPFVAAGTISLE